jgi:hypothetical protein
MPKNIDDVIVPTRRKSIRNVPLPQSRIKVSLDGVAPKKVHVPKVDEEDAPPPPPKLSPRRPSPGRNKKRLLLSILAAAVILVFATLSMFQGATLAYTPKSAQMTFASDVFSAAKTGEGELMYSVVKLSGDKGKSVAATGEKNVERKASGVIIVYNDTTSEQKLIENTRFESAAGKIYRIQQAITLPPKKGTQPGSLEVTVFADAAGESYNSAPTDFTVPGLKGSPRYTTIYARSKTTIFGGFAGKEKSVGEADLIKARSELRATLTDELLAKAQAEVPQDFILFPSLSSITFEDQPQTSGADANSVTVNLRGHLYGIMFKKTELAKELAKNKTQLLANDSVELESFEGLKFSFSGTPPTDLISLNKINFKVEGNAKLLWRTDEVALKSDLLGRQKKEVSSILKNYPTIASADTILRPFWKRAFPGEAAKITIKKLKAQ